MFAARGGALVPPIREWKNHRLIIDQ